MIKKELLDILCCPETQQGLFLAEVRLIEKINQRVEKGHVKNRAGEVLTQKIEAGLIRTDKKYLYPVRNDIPVMLLDEAIPLDGIL